MFLLMTRLKISQSNLVDGEWENTYNVEINEDGKISMLDSGYYRNGDLTGQ